MTHTSAKPAQAVAATGYWPAVGDEVDIIGGPYPALRGRLGVVVSVEQYHRDWCRVQANGRRGSYVYHAAWLRPLEGVEWR